MIYSVPYLYFDSEIVDDGIPRAKLDTQRGLMILLKSILSKSQKQTRFTHTCIAIDVLESPIIMNLNK